MNDLPSKNMASQTIGNAFFEILGNLRGVFGSEKRVGQSLTLKYFHGVQVFAENQMHWLDDLFEQQKLGGVFKYFVFSLLLGENSHFD